MSDEKPRGRFECGNQDRRGVRSQPGQSGNPGGAPRIPRQLRELARDGRTAAVQVGGTPPLDFLVGVYNDDKLPMHIRLAAAAYALPYLHSRLPPMDPACPRASVSSRPVDRAGSAGATERRRAGYALCTAEEGDAGGFALKQREHQMTEASFATQYLRLSRGPCGVRAGSTTADPIRVRGHSRL